MSFRLSSLNLCRPGMVGFICLALVGAARAGEEGVRNIEVVPLRGTSMDTNFDQSSPDAEENFKAWSPHAPRPVKLQAPGAAAMIPPPQPQTREPSEREKELLDRRKNWVFMTPEDYASQDGKKDGIDEDGLDKKSTTAMERYYQRLSDSGHVAATNQFNNLDSHRFDGQTISGTGDARNPRNPDGGSFGESPFNAIADTGNFQSLRRNDSSNPFGSDSSSALPTPEEVRAQAEQKAHLESFRQIWNIDQPAAASVSLPVSVPVNSGPLFGLSAPGIGPGNSESSSGAGSSSKHSQTPEPAAVSSRYTKPPHADFIPVQRPF